MSVNIHARSRAIARFEAMTAAALPASATIASRQDRRGRLLLQCTWPVSGIETGRSVRLVLSAETVSSYLTATHEQRLEAQGRFAQWIQKQMRRPVETTTGPIVEEWVMGPQQLFSEE